MAVPIPVFAYPAELLFNAHDREQHKHMITIYNPYDFPILYRILCTNPELFTLRDSEGSVSVGHTIDIIVRLTSQVPAESSTPLRSKFRVQVYDARTKNPVGRRDIVAKVNYTTTALESPSTSGGSERGSSVQGVTPSHDRRGGDSDNTTMPGTGVGYRGGSGAPGPPPNNMNYVAIITGIICICALMLPSDKEPSPNLPSYLHLTLNQKLLLAYTLGLVTMVIFRP